MVWCEVSVVDGCVDVGWCGAEDCENVGVLGRELWVWVALGCVFGFGLVEGEAGELHVLLDDVCGLVYEVCRDADV